MKHRWLLVISLLFIASASHAPAYGEGASSEPNSALDSWSRFGSLGIRFDSERLFGGRALSHVDGRGVELDPPNQADLLDLKGPGILSDWRPFRNSFRLSLGMYLDRSQSVHLDGARRWPEFEIDESLVSLGPQVETVPYVGFGWRHSAGDGLGVNLNIGAFLQDDSTLGDLCTSLEFSRRTCRYVAARIDQLNLSDSFEEFEWYPVLSLGIEYHF